MPAIPRLRGIPQLDTAHPEGATGGVSPYSWSLTTNGAGSVGINLEQWDGTTLTNKTGTGTSAVASNGRVTLSGVGDHAPVFYLFYRVSSNQAFGIGTDSSATFGLYIPQTVKLTQITNF